MVLLALGELGFGAIGVGCLGVEEVQTIKRPECVLLHLLQGMQAAVLDEIRKAVVMPGRNRNTSALNP